MDTPFLFWLIVMSVYIVNREVKATRKVKTKLKRYERKP